MLALDLLGVPFAEAVNVRVQREAATTAGGIPATFGRADAAVGIEGLRTGSGG